MDLKPNGSEIMVTNENKREYIEYVYAHLQFFIIVNSMSGGLYLDHLSKQIAPWPARLSSFRKFRL